MTADCQLTESLEDYLEVIQELINAEGHAHSKKIAARLQVTMPSVTAALRQLAQRKLIRYDSRYPVILTPAGKAIAEEVLHRHSALKKFFSEILGVPLNKAGETACRLEHIVDADIIRRFILFSDALSQRRDALPLQTYLTEASEMLDDPELHACKTLERLAAGEEASVTKLSRNIQDASALPLKIGDRIAMQGYSLDRSAVRILRNGQPLDLPVALAENIWVQPAPKPEAR